jgi:Uma2 family endonuclease
MAVDTKLITAEEFAAMEPDEYFTELIRGELVQVPPPGQRHGRLIARLVARFVSAVEEPQRGTVVTGSGVIITHSPDSVLAPDVAVYLGAAGPVIEESEKYENRLPDIVVEVVSPSDLAADVQVKVGLYLEAGVQMVIVVWPRTREITIRRPMGTTETLSEEGRLDFDMVVPGFSLPVKAIFE